MNAENQIPNFILALLEGSANKEQNQQASEWLQKKENLQLFNKLRRINNLSTDFNLFERFNLLEGKREIQSRLLRNKRKQLIFNLQKVAAILVIPLILLTAWYFIQNNQLKNEIASVGLIQNIKTEPGIHSNFILPDGTEVWLNSSSKISFPNVFNGNTRTVSLEGEAYFKVFKDASKPFVVNGGTMEIVALGTEFNVSAYKEDDYIKASLVEGKVRVTDLLNKQHTAILNPDQQVYYEKNTNDFQLVKVNSKDVSAWKEGKLVFNDTRLQEVVTVLSRWFNVDITIGDEFSKEYQYTATFTKESVSQVLDLLSLSAPIKFYVNGIEDYQQKVKSGDQIIIQRK